MKGKSQVPQMIILGIMVAMCAGYVVVKMTAKKPTPAPAAPAAQAQSAPSKAAAQTTTGSESKEAQTVEGKTVVATAAVMPQAARRDPFAPAIVATTMSCPPPPGPSNRMKIAKMDMLPPWIPPIGTGNSGTAGTAAPVEEAFPDFQVTGVITGRTNVAIVRLGEDKFIIREGQTISGKYRVVTVSQDGVLISHDGRSVFLKLGGEVNAS